MKPTESATRAEEAEAGKGPCCPDSGDYYPEGTLRCPKCGQELADDDKDDFGALEE